MQASILNLVYIDQPLFIIAHGLDSFFVMHEETPEAPQRLTRCLPLKINALKCMFIYNNFVYTVALHLFVGA